MLRIILMLLVTLSFIAPALAGACERLVCVGDNFDLSTGLTTQRRAPSVSYNSVSNEYLVVWFDTRNPGNNDIFGQRVVADGSLAGSNIAIMEYADAQIDPFVAANSIDNEYLVAWRTQQAGYFNKSRGQRVAADGSLIDSDFYIGNGFEISMVHNPAENEFLHTGRSPGIRGRRISNTGTLLGSEIIIATAGAPAPNGQVAYDSTNDRYLATWRNQTDENLQGQLVAADGSLVGGPILISPTFPGSGRAAAVAYDPTYDRYLVTFGVFQGNDLLGQFVSSSGDLVGSNFTIATGLANQADPCVAYSAAAEVYAVAWRDGNDIVARVVAADGTVAEDMLDVVIGTASSGRPAIAFNSTVTDFLVAWPDNRNLGVGEEDIFAQLIACEDLSSIDREPERSLCFALDDAVPNPFAAVTTIRLTLPDAESARLTVSDVSGRTVRILFDGQQPAGVHTIHWDGRDASGSPVPSGVYFCRLEAGGRTAQRKLLELR